MGPRIGPEPTRGERAARRRTPLKKESPGGPGLFITARFRSGSTLLWNLYRQVPEVAAYYEPLHDRLLDWLEHPIKPQPTHFHVDDYFGAYPPREELAAVHRRWFAGSDLYLEAGDSAPELEAYVRYLLEAARPRLPVLQFNRVDFRLGWLRERFPGVPILHLVRRSRDEWRSAVKDYPGQLDLEADPYAMTTWARDLSRHFPFLASDQISHLYQRHYYLWRMSGLLGERQADRTVAYEDLLADPGRVVSELLEMAGLPLGRNLAACLAVLEGPTTKAGSRKEEAFFARLEDECEQVLDDLGITRQLGLVPWREIVESNPKLLQMVAEGEQRWAARSAHLAASRLSAEAEDKERAIQRLARELADSQDAANGAQEQMVEKELGIHRLASELTDAQAAAQVAHEQLSEKELGIQRLASELADTQAAVEVAQEELTEKELGIQRLARELAESQAAAGLAQAGLVEKELGIQRLARDLAESQAAADGARIQLTEKEEAIGRLARELAESQAASNGTRTQLTEKESAIERLARELGASQAVAEGVQARLAEREAAIERLARELGEIQAGAAGAHAQLLEKQVAIERLAGELADSQAMAAGTEVQVLEKEAAIERLATELAETRSAAAATQAEVLQKEAAIERLAGELAATQAAAAGTEAQLLEKEAAIDGLAQALGEAQESAIGTEAQLRDARAVVDRMAGELAESQAIAAGARSEVLEREAALEGLALELAEIQLVMEANRAELFEKEEVIEGLALSLSESRAAAEEARATVRKREESIESLGGKLAQMESAVEETRAVLVEKAFEIESLTKELAASQEYAQGQLFEKESVIQGLVRELAGSQSGAEVLHGLLKEKERQARLQARAQARAQQKAEAAKAALVAETVAKEAVIQGLVVELAAAQAQAADGHSLSEEKEAVIQRQHADLGALHQLLADKERHLRRVTPVRSTAGRARRWLLRALTGGSSKPVADQLKTRLRPSLWHLEQYEPRPLNGTRVRPHGGRSSTRPSISIVTPSYNQGQFIEATLTSVLDQGYPNLEYVVQDGGSKDETVSILDRFAEQLKSVESARDGGQADAINRGFAKTTGEIMGYLNSDDVLLPGSLGYVGGFFATNPRVDVIYGHRIVIDAEGREIGRWVLPPHDDRTLKWADFVPQETMFWRRSLFEKVGGRIDDSLHFCIDWDLILRFQAAGARFVRVPRFLGAFRYQADSKTASQLDTRGTDEMNVLRERYLGRPVTQAEVDVEVARYVRRHVVFRELNRFGLARY